MKNPNPQELSFWTAMYSEPVNRSQLSQLSQHNELEEAVEKREVWPSLRRLLPCDSDLDKWQKMDVWMAFGTVHTLTYYVLSLKPNLVFQGWLCRVKVNTAHLRLCKPTSTNLTMYISYIQTFF